MKNNVNSNTKDFFEDPQIIEERVTKLSEQIGSLKTDTVVTVPVYAGENHEDLKTMIRTLKQQKNVGEKIVLYVNAPGKFSKDSFDETVQAIKNFIGDDTDRFVVLEQHYTEENVKPIGTIRADMLDAIISSLEKTEKEPIIIGLDADLKSISSQNYFEKQREFFDSPENSKTLWNVASLRFTDPTEHPAAWFSMRILQTLQLQQKK